MDSNSHDNELLEIKRRRLRELEKQAARYGQDCPPHVSMEITDLLKQIAELEPKQTIRSDVAQVSSQVFPDNLLEDLLFDLPSKDANTRDKPIATDVSTTASSESPTQTSASPKVPMSRKKLRGKLRLFLCHSSGDKDIVYDLYHRLQNDGFRPWLDKENLVPGQDWDLEIAQEVRRTHVVIVCLSHHSITREGYFHKEIKIALDTADEKPEGTIYIVPLMIEPCPLPVRLSKWHAVALYEAQGYNKVVVALQTRAEQLQVTGTLTLPTQDYERVNRAQPKKPVVSKARTGQTQTTSGNHATTRAASSHTIHTSVNARKRQDHSQSRLAQTSDLNQEGFLVLRKDWRSVLKRQAIYIWLIIVSFCIVLYRAAGIVWFTNDAVVLLGFISSLVFANTYNRRGMLSKAARVISVLYLITFIASYALFYAPQGQKIIRVSEYAAVTSLDTISGILLLTALASGIWILSRILRI